MPAPCRQTGFAGIYDGSSHHFYHLKPALRRLILGVVTSNHVCPCPGNSIVVIQRYDLAVPDIHSRVSVDLDNNYVHSTSIIHAFSHLQWFFSPADELPSNLTGHGALLVLI